MTVTKAAVLFKPFFPIFSTKMKKWVAASHSYFIKNISMQKKFPIWLRKFVFTSTLKKGMDAPCKNNKLRNLLQITCLKVIAMKQLKISSQVGASDKEPSLSGALQGVLETSK